MIEKFLLGTSYKNLCAKEIEIRGSFVLINALNDVIQYLRYKNQGVKFWEKLFWELNELRKNNNDDSVDYQSYLLNLKSDFKVVFEMFFNEFPTMYPAYDIVKFGHENDYIKLELSSACKNILSSRFDQCELKLNRDIANLKKAKIIVMNGD